MSSQQLDEEAIFHLARKLPDAADRVTYLDQICAGDQNLRNRVEALLEVHEHEQEFLKSEPEAAPTVDHAPLTERAGSTIGRYRLMEQIGEGGMGTVFVAEQERPIRRKVALKVIKPGMDSKAVVARFEAERQALALMDHPSIAKVLDAGTTDTGRPYFVMELVRGIPITEYCDQHKLTIRERLELFIQVCQAIQHAHQKAIIHRDIKPTNVLVTEQDGKAVPKVIDFGVAKALNQRLTERTIYTTFAQVVGTPLYMSPEQAALSAVDVDTRSDVYSLGVLLYELLTGTTPFDRQRFEQAAYDEIRRIVREEEPPKPSTKISTLSDQGNSVAQNRRTEQDKLGRAVRGDLDWIVMTALAKERSRRYESASRLAEDLQRHLNNDVVEARPPSTAYRLSRFYSRNRVAVVSAALLLSLLAIAVPVTAIGWRQAWTARIAADKQRGIAERESAQKEETLARLSETAFEEAVAAALAGDAEKANEALSNAIDAGLDDERAALMQALLALTTGDFQLALTRAEALPETDSSGFRVGKIAVISAASYWLGYCDKAELQLGELRRIEPETDAEHLLKSYALVVSDPKKALEILETRPRVMRSPVGLFIRSQAKLLIAIDQGDPTLLDEVVTDFDYVAFLFPDRSRLFWHAQALAYGIVYAKRDGRHDDVARFTEIGRPLVDEVLSNEYTPNCYGQWLFYRATDEQHEAEDAIRRLVVPGANSWFFGAHCLAHYNSADALRHFDELVGVRNAIGKYAAIARAHLRRDSSENDHGIRADLHACLQDRSPLIARHALCALALVSTENELRAMAREVRPRLEASDDIYIGTACVDFFAGHLDEEGLLEKSGDSGWAKINAYFSIAMLRLAMSDRAGAKKYFELAVDTDMIGSFDYEWARAYLTRMNSDPTWPSWLAGQN